MTPVRMHIRPAPARARATLEPPAPPARPAENETPFEELGRAEHTARSVRSTAMTFTAPMVAAGLLAPAALRAPLAFGGSAVLMAQGLSQRAEAGFIQPPPSARDRLIAAFMGYAPFMATVPAGAAIVTSPRFAPAVRVGVDAWTHCCKSALPAAVGARLAAAPVASLAASAAAQWIAAGVGSNAKFQFLKTQTGATPVRRQAAQDTDDTPPMRFDPLLAGAAVAAFAPTMAAGTPQGAAFMANRLALGAVGRSFTTISLAMVGAMGTEAAAILRAGATDKERQPQPAQAQAQRPFADMDTLLRV